MAHLKLETRIDFTVPYVYRGVTPPELIAIPNYKAYVRLTFVPPVERDWHPDRNQAVARRFEAIVDTGASLSSLPYQIWAAYESEIRWIERADDDPIALGGEILHYRLGRVLLAATDLDGRWFPPEWTLARCLQETESPLPALLGLQWPFLTGGHRLRHDGLPGEQPTWWLEEAA